MNQQFGVSYEEIPKSDVAGYGCKIPSILVMMRDFLESHDGRDQVGIFRLAPDKDDCDAIKRAINRGEFGDGEAVKDVNIIANLIKVGHERPETPVCVRVSVYIHACLFVAPAPFTSALEYPGIVSG